MAHVTLYHNHHQQINIFVNHSTDTQKWYINISSMCIGKSYTLRRLNRYSLFSLLIEKERLLFTNTVVVNKCCQCPTYPSLELAFLCICSNPQRPLLRAITVKNTILPQKQTHTHIHQAKKVPHNLDTLLVAQGQKSPGHVSKRDLKNATTAWNPCPTIYTLHRTGQGILHQEIL